MARRKNILSKGLGANIGWILVLLLVAGTSFLLGSSVNKKADGQTLGDSNSNATQQQSIIGDISASLQSPAPEPVSVASPNTSAPSSAISAIVNINTGTLAELDTLPGIGPAYAQAIINYRSTNGPFIRIEDIQKVKGIGPKTFEKLKSRITI